MHLNLTSVNFHTRTSCNPQIQGREHVRNLLVFCGCLKFVLDVYTQSVYLAVL
jgi:hypothetical protein